jgi:hypothetical protein
MPGCLWTTQCVTALPGFDGAHGGGAGDELDDAVLHDWLL